MSDPTSGDPLRELQQTVTALGRTQAQTDEILLLLARRSSEHDAELQALRRDVRDILQATTERLDRIEATLERTATLQAENTIAIAELRTILRERYNGNGQGAD